MKKIICLALVLLCATVAFAQDPALGFWKSIDDDTGEVTAGWEVYEEDGILYGRILKVVGQPADALATACEGPYDDFPIAGDTSKMTLINTPWIYGLVNKGNGKWRNGRIIDPETGKDYASEITFHKAGGKYKVDTLEMRGKIGPFGRSQFWQKSTREEIMAL